MTTWNLSAVIFAPNYGNYLHWALCIRNGDKAIIFEVSGEHPNFQRNIDFYVPESSPRFRESIPLTKVADRDLEALKQAVASTVVDNETVEWDCQDYVLEILDKLEEECIIDGEDRGYLRRKRELKGRRGAVEE